MKTIGQMLHDQELVPGLLLELENGKRILIGHVNDCFCGETAHCLTEDILVGVKHSVLLDWASEKGWEDPPKATPEQADEESCTMLDVLLWYGHIEAGDVLELDNNKKWVVGNINVLGGECDAGTECGETRVLRRKRLL